MGDSKKIHNVKSFFINEKGVSEKVWNFYERKCKRGVFLTLIYERAN